MNLTDQQRNRPHYLLQILQGRTCPEDTRDTAGLLESKFTGIVRAGWAVAKGTSPWNYCCFQCWKSDWLHWMSLKIYLLLFGKYNKTSYHSFMSSQTCLLVTLRIPESESYLSSKSNTWSERLMFFTVMTFLPLQKEQFTFPTSSSSHPRLSEKITVSHMKYFQTRGGRFMENYSECIWAQTNSPSSILLMISMTSKPWLCQIFLLIGFFE